MEDKIESLKINDVPVSELENARHLKKLLDADICNLEMWIVKNSKIS